MRKTNQTNQSETTVSATASAFWGALKNVVSETSSDAIDSIKDITLEATKEKISQAADTVESYCAKKEDGTREITEDTVSFLKRNEDTVAFVSGAAIGAVGSYALGFMTAKTAAVNFVGVAGAWVVGSEVGKKIGKTILERQEEKRANEEILAAARKIVADQRNTNLGGK